jgi:hypothetical protein
MLALAERGGKQGGRSLAALATFVCAVLVIAVVVHDNDGREELMGSWMHDHSSNPSKLPMLPTPICTVEGDECTNRRRAQFCQWYRSLR